MSPFTKILAGFSLLFCNIAVAGIIPLSNCSELQPEKTVLLVYADWCGPCKSFLPKYIRVSNKPEFSDWKFYFVVDNDFHAICGTPIKVVPITYKNNMKINQAGDMSESALEEFIRRNHSSNASKEICTLGDNRE